MINIENGLNITEQMPPVSCPWVCTNPETILLTDCAVLRQKGGDCHCTPENCPLAVKEEGTWH